MTRSGSEQRNPGTITITLPLAVRKRGGRKLMLTLDGNRTDAVERTRANSPLLKAIARAYRWRRMLESGEYASIKELAAAEKINQSYVCRVLRLTLLAPRIVEAVLAGASLSARVIKLLEAFPLIWETQERVLADRK